MDDDGRLATLEVAAAVKTHMACSVLGVHGVRNRPASCGRGWGSGSSADRTARPQPDTRFLQLVSSAHHLTPLVVSLSAPDSFVRAQYRSSSHHGEPSTGTSVRGQVCARPLRVSTRCASAPLTNLFSSYGSISTDHPVAVSAVPAARSVFPAAYEHSS
jgi:hypothetical protein